MDVQEENNNTPDPVDTDVCDSNDIDLNDPDPDNSYQDKQDDSVSNQENHPNSHVQDTQCVNQEDSEGTLKFSDKASFREKSSYFQSVLADSSRYRNLPEPKGKRPGRLEEIRDRPLPEMAENEDDLVGTPRSTPRGGGPGLLTRAKAMPSLKQEPAADDGFKSRYSQYTDQLPLPGNQPPGQPGTPRGGQPPPVSRLSLPPVAGGRVGDHNTKQDNILAYSRQGNDVAARLRVNTNVSQGSPHLARSYGGDGSTPNNSPAAGSTTPRLGDPVKNRDSNRISLDMQPLSSPRLNAK